MKKSINAFIFLLAYFTYAQTTISGKATDSLQNPLAYANILAIPEAEDQEITYAITQENGTYKLGLSKNQTYKVTISYLGCLYEELLC